MGRLPYYSNPLIGHHALLTGYYRKVTPIRQQWTKVSGYTGNMQVFPHLFESPLGMRLSSLENLTVYFQNMYIQSFHLCLNMHTLYATVLKVKYMFVFCTECTSGEKKPNIQPRPFPNSQIAALPQLSCGAI